MNPGKFYNNHLEMQMKLKDRLSKKSNLISTIRVVVFLAFITAILYELNDRALQQSILLSLLLVLVLAFLIKSHNKIKAQLTMAENLANLSSLELNRLEGNYEKIDDGQEFKNDLHRYSSDLDFFGLTSIFQFINQTTSFIGKQKLASWLLSTARNPHSCRDEILKRQLAAKELCQDQSWCLQYRATGLSEHIDENQVSTFNDWLHQESILLEKVILKYSIIILPLLVISITAGSFMFDYTLYFTFPVLVMSGILLWRQHKYATQTVNDTYKALATLQVLAKQLTILEKSEFSSEYLLEIQKTVVSSRNAAREIKRLHQLLDYLQSRNSMMHFLINIPFMLDIRWLIKLEEWKKENAGHVENWFESLAKTESLISLSGLYFNHPTWTTPTFSDRPYYFKAAELIHPMLGSQGVSNNFSFEGIGTTNLITGPNMAGKSTFLRTIATSWVFAQIGAPVNAKQFVVNPEAQVFTAMRVKDNLSENVSSFYAELDRIKQLIENIKSGKQYLYFLDEILKGTNSADRHKGAEALIRQLHKLGATGFVSTHDLELGELAANENYVRNYSFESEIKNGQITFDYTIKKGICSSFNACELMRQMGIEV